MSTFKVLAGNLQYRTSLRLRYRGRLLVYSHTEFFYLQVSERFSNKQQTLLFFHKNGSHHPLATPSVCKDNANE